MGTSTSAAEFGRKLHRFTQQVGDVKPALIEGAEVGKMIFRAQAAAAGVLGSTAEGKRKPVGVKDDFIKIAGQDAVVVTYTGPAHLFNNPTAPHFIGAKLLGTRTSLRQSGRRLGSILAFGGDATGVFGPMQINVGYSRYGSTRHQRATGQLRRRRGSKALIIDGNFRPYAFHPGTPGKQFFQSAKPKVVRAVPPLVARKVLTQPLRAVFG